LLVTAAKQINIPLSSDDWSKHRRAIGEVRQDLRDLLDRTLADPKDQMESALMLERVKGGDGLDTAVSLVVC
jgi:cytochrome P450